MQTCNHRGWRWDQRGRLELSLFRWIAWTWHLVDIAWYRREDRLECLGMPRLHGQIDTLKRWRDLTLQEELLAACEELCAFDCNG